jgi:LmbE family N-acetylglucosaminyl deacetylase
VQVLCFTHAEASTLDGASRPLGAVRAEELRAAAAVLGVDEVTLLSYPDGDLGEILKGAVPLRVARAAPRLGEREKLVHAAARRRAIELLHLPRGGQPSPARRGPVERDTDEHTLERSTRGCVTVAAGTARTAGCHVR